MLIGSCLPSQTDERRPDLSIQEPGCWRTGYVCCLGYYHNSMMFEFEEQLDQVLQYRRPCGFSR